MNSYVHVNFPTHHLMFKGKTLTIQKPLIMGILNITPDSFSTVGRFQDIDAAVAHGIRLVKEGADILDIGGEPTNPFLAPVVSLETELARVVPVVEKLRQAVDVPISVDTSKPEVFEAVIKAGADIINDVRALRLPNALETVAKYDVAVCLMHMSHPFGAGEGVSPYDESCSMVSVVKQFLEERVKACLDKGIGRERIILDPGIGAGNFGKTRIQNLQLLNHLNEFHSLDLPILIGVSRKAFIGEHLDLPAEDRLAGSLGVSVVAAMKGATIIRTHDVKATRDAITMATAILTAG